MAEKISDMTIEEMAVWFGNIHQPTGWAGKIHQSIKDFLEKPSLEALQEREISRGHSAEEAKSLAAAYYDLSRLDDKLFRRFIVPPIMVMEDRIRQGEAQHG